MITLDDKQNAIVLEAAAALPDEKRDVFLWRVDGYLDLYASYRPTMEQVEIAIRAGAHGLTQLPQRGVALGALASGESAAPSALK